MNKSNLKIILFLFFPFLIMLTGCPSDWEPVPDAELYEDFEPLEWKDTYVFAPSNRPCHINVWDSETGCLVRTYDLRKKTSYRGQPETRVLRMSEMTVFGKSIWFDGEGRQRHLVRIDVQTGKIYFLNPCVYSVGCVYNSDGTEDSLWAATYSDYHVGFAAYKYLPDGSFAEEIDVSGKDIDFDSIKGIYKYNSEYYITASKFQDFSFTEEDRKGFKLIHLSSSDPNKISEIPFDAVFPTDQFLKDNTISTLGNGKYNKEFGIGAGDTYGDNPYEQNRFISLNVVFRDEDCNCKVTRFLYRNNKTVPASFEYTGIKSDNEDGRAMFFAAESNDYYFIGGRATNLVEGDDWMGIEIGVYSKSNCEQIKRFRFIDGNQLYACRERDCAWFPRDLMYGETPPYQEYNDKAAIYKLDYETARAYIYHADGSFEELDPES